jgi:alpha-tubulin suppressor-like RCC1 family protein
MYSSTVWHRWAWVAAVTVGVGAIACGGDGGGPTKITPGGGADTIVAAVAVTLSLDTLEAIGATSQATAAATNDSGRALSGKTFSYSSSNTSVATVDPASGVVTSVGNGEVTITASVQSTSGGAPLFIAQRVSAVTVAPGTATIDAGQVQQFTATAKDANDNDVTGVNFFWASSNQSVAMVDPASGLATAVNVGSATVTALGQGEPGSATLAVGIGVPDHMTFTTVSSPWEGNVGSTVVAELKDEQDNTITGYTGAVTLGFMHDAWGAPLNRASILSGTLTLNAVAGVATFSGISIDRPGAGFMLRASADGAGGVGGESNQFDVSLTSQSLDAGNYHNCAITTGGVYCWGASWNGQTGVPQSNFGQDSVPGLVTGPGGVLFTTVSSGSDHTCGLTAGGQAYCWGYNYYGQLGNGTNIQTYIPVAVSGGLTFTTIAAGSSHTCGIAGGLAYCWGYNGQGQLGDNTNTQSNTPVAASGGRTFSAISAGSNHTCGIVVGTNAGYCWGYNNDGQLGVDTTGIARANVLVPTAVSGGPAAFASIDLGSSHTCGRSTSGGAGYCWGRNNSGQLGIDTTGQGTLDQFSPVIVTGGHSFNQITAGPNHSCGITSAGTNLCWGNNGDGQLGNGTTTRSFVPVVVSGGLALRSIGAGQGHTCGVTTSDEVYCWGGNWDGQLGLGSSQPRQSFVPLKQPWK